ncbi:hypothetical protein [Nostoc sp. DedQUE09]|uniref:hypothetical protein n=1 Tax=Nostoc sp. DedQUE09 TaxID=3075394 RepID=UPI002AD24446|nr:hypothetical protein [Nostoc sp. DedQUE09]
MTRSQSPAGNAFIESLTQCLTGGSSPLSAIAMLVWEMELFSTCIHTVALRIGETPKALASLHTASYVQRLCQSNP